MAKSKFKTLQREVEKILAKSPIDFEIPHSRLVLKYVLKLKPDVSEGMKIAAIAHDIDRGVTGITETYDLKDYSKLPEFKKQHALRSAQAIIPLLKKYKYKKSTIAEVVDLIKKHEVGGTSKSDILMEADSLAYFNYNIPFYLEKNGQKRTRDKIKFMYQRLSSHGQRVVQKMKFQNKRIKALVYSALVATN